MSASTLAISGLTPPAAPPQSGPAHPVSSPPLAVVAAHPAAADLAEAVALSQGDTAAREQTAALLRAQRRVLLTKVVAPVLGLLLMLLVWQLVAQTGDKQLPGPIATWDAAVKLFADPFYVKGPNDQGIGWNVLSSLQRVALGFGLAALVGIPLGFAIGRFSFLNQMLDPIISLLRPVSPLAWLPIGLMVFKAANPAAIWTIFICSIWPMVINTAVGVRQVPQDYLNVARVLNLSEWTILRKILFPAVLPYMLTGVRLAVGTAWLVIVAAEMLTGGQGIGFWLWDEWNNLNVAHILIAIFVIGGVGLLLEALLVAFARRFEYR
ncbi:nitrate ABC transporter permease [Sphaerotilus mobilis]|uniref:Nitrate/nitrite transport system permease protein n=1 Tax=Sphaerotilus mobilis TaxID=47994 RepID=A0A4Q7LPJ6_9BURK|nr:nitrate ABC transporter permease [Sphaerotilus mobilis]RZS56636.1 nitrate/nitrite transport system permease protein [Sphaerotilus mobilis]